METGGGWRGSTERENDEKAQNSFISGPHHSENDGIAEESSKAKKESERADTLRGTEGPVFEALLGPSCTSLSGRGSPEPSCSFQKLCFIQVCSRAKAAVDSLSALEGGQGSEGAATVATAA